MEELSYQEKKRIRNRLLAIFRESGKVTERDLFRLSALTGISYSAIVKIHNSIRYRPLRRFKKYFQGKTAGGESH